jgi:hypothetical protein
MENLQNLRIVNRKLQERGTIDSPYFTNPEGNNITHSMKSLVK